MNTLNIKEHLLIIYLAIVLLILTPYSLLAIISILLPLAITSFGIYLKKTYIGLIGISLIYLISLQNLQITSMENITQLLIYIFIIIAPSIILLSYILQLSHPSNIIFTTPQKKPLIIALASGISILIAFYILALFTPSGSILAPDTIEIQILIIAALSTFICIPLIIK